MRMGGYGSYSQRGSHTKKKTACTGINRKKKTHYLQQAINLIYFCGARQEPFGGIAGEFPNWFPLFPLSD